MVLAVSDESDELVSEYIDKMGLGVSIASGFTGTGAWGVEGYPSAALINPSGEVTWTGHPSEISSSKIKGAKPAKGGYLSFGVDREYSSKLNSAVKSAAEGKLGKALSAAQKVAGDVKADPAVRAEAEELAGELLGFARLLQSQAEGLIEDRLVLRGIEVLETLGSELKGTELGGEIVGRLKEIDQDDDLQTELAAAKAFQKAQAAIEKRGLKKAVKKLESIVKKYPGTKAADRANALLRRA